ncbi:hypothetical protein Fmac_019484 [Flemingia macrophylla]|uniref:Uncharacterized protein n=1 Tax=Flemingia macrophylla TaxID=520843 RepID=A0ABD1M7X0_9FABA
MSFMRGVTSDIAEQVGQVMLFNDIQVGRVMLLSDIVEQVERVMLLSDIAKQVGRVMLLSDIDEQVGREQVERVILLSDTTKLCAFHGYAYALLAYKRYASSILKVMKMLRVKALMMPRLDDCDDTALIEIVTSGQGLWKTGSKIDSLHSALYRSAVSSDVLSVFIQTHVVDFNHRLHALLAHSSSNHARLQDNLTTERSLREQAVKLLSEREAFFSRKLGAFEDLQRERDSALSSSRHSLFAIEVLKEELHPVTRERDQIQSVNVVRAREIAALKDLSVIEMLNVVDEAQIEKESVGKLFEDERKKVDKLELAMVGTKEVVAKTEAELQEEGDKLHWKQQAAAAAAVATKQG